MAISMGDQASLQPMSFSTDIRYAVDTTLTIHSTLHQEQTFKRFEQKKGYYIKNRQC